MCCNNQWKLDYFMAIVNGDLIKVEKFALKHGVNVRLSVDLCYLCTFFESYLNKKPTSDEVEKVLSSTESCCEDFSSSSCHDESQYVGCRPIHVACGHGQSDVVNYLLTNQADVNVKTIEISSTPLQLALRLTDVSPELCAALVQNGALLDVTNGNGTPLHTAISEHSPDVVEALLSARDRFQETVSRAFLTYNQFGDLPLHIALHARSARVVRLLVDAGVDVNTLNQHNTGPLVVAIHNNDDDSAKVLLHGNSTISSLNTALLHAVHYGSYELTVLLLDAGADPNHFLSDSSPLMTAAVLGRTDVLKLFISRGADIERTNDTGYTALHFAAWEGVAGSVEALLRAGAHDDIRTCDGNTPLALACHGDHSDIAAVFINRNCNANNSDRDSDTPLLYCCFNGDLATVKLLVERGEAMADSKNRIGVTAVWNASYAGHFDVLQYLILTCNPSLSVASRGLEYHSAGSLQAPTIYQLDRTPLYVALDQGHNLIAHMILSSGAQMSDEPWYWNNDLPPQLETCWIQKLDDLAHNAPSLTHLVRCYMRRLLGNRVTAVVPELDIPTTLKDFLLLQFH